MPDAFCRPPQLLLQMASRMPRESHALFVIEDGKPNDPEFVVWGRDDYREELWKWKRKGIRFASPRVEFIAKHGPEWVKTNPFSV
jgi:hypothetical protein